MQTKIRIADLLGGIFSIAVGGVVYYFSRSFPPSPRPIEPGPAFFPSIIAYGFGLMGFLLIALGFRGGGYELKVQRSLKSITQQSNIRKLFLVILSIVYIIIIPYTGFAIATFLFLVLLMRYLGANNYIKIVSISVATSLSLSYIFRQLLLVDLPEKIPFLL